MLQDILLEEHLQTTLTTDLGLVELDVCKNFRYTSMSIFTVQADHAHAIASILLTRHVHVSLKLLFTGVNIPKHDNNLPPIGQVTHARTWCNSKLILLTWLLAKILPAGPANQFSCEKPEITSYHLGLYALSENNHRAGT